jgi:PTS system nitrogen regulatory IIA component
MFNLDFIKLKSPPSFPVVKRHIFKRKENMEIIDYLDDRLISFLDVETRDEAIDALIDLVCQVGVLQNKPKFRSAVMHREDLVSTGIGLGIAIPHAKLSDLNDFFIVIGIQRKKGIDWNALDKAPVRLIFLIGGPDHRQSEYLQILSRLTAAIKDVDRRKEILKVETPQEVLALFGAK